ncbi:cell division protein ZapD [Paraglaciecola aquimarina]|uniref:Cell division protein ZapD n=1 Tax=Paraglaciecola aquimarina TaxID=1235557 RepID=A0ABU3SWD2_9ALTE|nr:cell division protein ZapD [Paraglaciecola aquimarina]MDU0354305.1 cell division protein ZapD [Paraglaciecola aquimarina]
MSHAIYEFPLNEKVRTYLRLEQLFEQLEHAKQADEDWQYINFLDCLFTLLDLLERIDLRNDVLKDIELHERNLVIWSQHPNIDNDALQSALQKILRLREALKGSKKIGSELKEDKFLSSIRQRFSIPGGTCSFDLPSLYYWLKQPLAVKQQGIVNWLQELIPIQQAMLMTLSFLRERGRFGDVTAEKGFYQGVADDKNELIRVLSLTDQGYYPMLSGNKYRYAIRFTLFTPTAQGNSGVESAVPFKLASC